MRRILPDRAAYLADPDFSDVPVAGLTAPCYANERPLRSTRECILKRKVKAVIHVSAEILQATLPYQNDRQLGEGPTRHTSPVVMQRETQWPAPTR